MSKVNYFILQQYNYLKLLQYKGGLLGEFSLQRPSGPIQSLSRNVSESCVCAMTENPFPGGLETSLVEELTANIGQPLDFSHFLDFLALCKPACCEKQESLQGEGL